MKTVKSLLEKAEFETRPALRYNAQAEGKPSATDIWMEE